jgi:hypothetical protein
MERKVVFLTRGNTIVGCSLCVGVAKERFLVLSKNVRRKRDSIFVRSALTSSPLHFSFAALSLSTVVHFWRSIWEAPSQNERETKPETRTDAFL